MSDLGQWMWRKHKNMLEGVLIEREPFTAAVAVASSVNGTVQVADPITSVTIPQNLVVIGAMPVVGERVIVWPVSGNERIAMRLASHLVPSPPYVPPPDPPVTEYYRMIDGTKGTTVATAAGTTLTDLTWPALNGEYWYFRFEDTIWSPGGAAGLRMGITGPAGSTTSHYIWGSSTSTLNYISGKVTTVGSVGGPTLGQINGSNGIVIMEGVIRAGANGDFGLIFASSVSGSEIQLDSRGILHAKKVQ